MFTVLLIDDDDKFRQLAAKLLKDRGMNVVAAASVAEANSVVDTREFELFIVDGCLGDGNGEEWLGERRRRGDDTPAVFVSGLWRQSEAYYRLISELDVQLVVHKPVQARLFVDQVCQIASYNSQKALPEECTDSGDYWQLAAEYIYELPERIYELVESLTGCEEGRPGAFDDAIREAHRLRGTGGVFGQAWVSEIAAEIEDTLKSLPPAGTVEAYTEKIRTLIGVAANGYIRAQIIPICEMPEAARQQEFGKTEPLKAPRVLLIDDDPYFCRSVECVLGGQGIIVTTFNDTVRVLDLLDEVAPQLVILNVDLPRMTGLDLCKQMRMHFKWRHLPVLIVTEDGPSVAYSKVLYASATDYRTKPISNKELSQWVMEYIQHPDTNKKHFSEVAEA